MWCEFTPRIAQRFFFSLSLSLTFGWGMIRLWDVTGRRSKETRNPAPSGPGERRAWKEEKGGRKKPAVSICRLLVAVEPLETDG